MHPRNRPAYTLFTCFCYTHAAPAPGLSTSHLLLPSICCIWLSIHYSHALYAIEVPARLSAALPVTGDLLEAWGGFVQLIVRAYFEKRYS